MCQFKPCDNVDCEWPPNCYAIITQHQVISFILISDQAISFMNSTNREIVWTNSFQFVA